MKRGNWETTGSEKREGRVGIINANHEPTCRDPARRNRICVSLSDTHCRTPGLYIIRCLVSMLEGTNIMCSMIPSCLPATSDTAEAITRGETAAKDRTRAMPSRTDRCWRFLSAWLPVSCIWLLVPVHRPYARIVVAKYVAVALPRILCIYI